MRRFGGRQGVHLIADASIRADEGTAYDVIGREAERRAASSFLDRVGLGPAVLHLEGQAGIGKTMVWQEIVRTAAGRGYEVLQCRPTSSEGSLAYVGLADLLAGVYAEPAEGLPWPQRVALDAALLRAEPEAGGPDQRAVATGFLTLLGLLAERAPVVVAVDDAQWLDRSSARVLEFAARRLHDRRIGLLCSSRPDAGLPGFVTASAEERVQHLELGPLSLAALYRLIESRLGLRLPRPLLLKVEAVSAGNPMFALEIARVLDKTGLPGSGVPLPVPGSLAELVSTKIEGLPKATREAVLVASALSRPSVDLVDVGALEPAVSTGVVAVNGDRVVFTHPLFAAAAYASAGPVRRRRLHAQLAALVSDPEERARHLMRASTGPDAEVADALDRAAAHAAQRHAPEAAAELEEDSARRTPPPLSALRCERLLRAAAYDIQAGDGDRARRLADEVLAAAPARAVRASALHLLAETCYRDRLPEARPLLEAALACVSDDSAEAVQLELSLSFVALATGDVAATEIHSQRASELAEHLGDAAVLAEALALKETASFFSSRGFDEAVLEQALLHEDPERRVPLQLRPSLNAAHLFEWTCQLDRARDLLEALRDRILERGEESDLPYVLVHLAACELFAGKLEAGERYADQALEAAELVESELMRGFALLARANARARRGALEGARADAEQSLAICERVGWPHGIYAARWALGSVALAEGDHQASVDALGPVVSAVEAVGVYERVWAMYLPDAIEALIAIDELEHAERLIDSIAECSRRLDRPWGLAESERCRALLEAARGNLDAAMAAAEAALAAHDRLAMPFERGRTLIVKGVLLRRARHKKAARDALEEARMTLEGIDAAHWAERARAELGRTGLRGPAPEDLTETENRVAELAAAGLTNKQVAAQAFLAPKSVEDILARVYRKLEIHSRAELGAKMVIRTRD